METKEEAEREMDREEGSKDFRPDGRSFAMGDDTHDTLGRKGMEQEKVEASLFFGGTVKEDAASWRRSQGNDALRLIRRLAPVERGDVIATLAVNTTLGFMDSHSSVNVVDS